MLKSTTDAITIFLQTVEEAAGIESSFVHSSRGNITCLVGLCPPEPRHGGNDRLHRAWRAPPTPFELPADAKVEDLRFLISLRCRGTFFPGSVFLDRPPVQPQDSQDMGPPAPDPALRMDKPLADLVTEPGEPLRLLVGVNTASNSRIIKRATGLPLSGSSPLHGRASPHRHAAAPPHGPARLAAAGASSHVQQALQAKSAPQKPRLVSSAPPPSLGHQQPQPHQPHQLQGQRQEQSKASRKRAQPQTPAHTVGSLGGAGGAGLLKGDGGGSEEGAPAAPEGRQGQQPQPPPPPQQQQQQQPRKRRRSVIPRELRSSVTPKRRKAPVAKAASSPGSGAEEELPQEPLRQERGGDGAPSVSSESLGERGGHWQGLMSQAGGNDEEGRQHGEEEDEEEGEGEEEPRGGEEGSDAALDADVQAHAHGTPANSARPNSVSPSAALTSSQGAAHVQQEDSVHSGPSGSQQQQPKKKKSQKRRKCVIPKSLRPKAKADI